MKHENNASIEWLVVGLWLFGFLVVMWFFVDAMDSYLMMSIENPEVVRMLEQDLERLQ